MLFYIYSDAPSSTIDITSRCRVDRPFQVKDNAEEGSVALSTLIVDDPDGDIEFTGHRRIYIYESDAPILDQNVFNGFIANERVSRGPYRTGPGRIWTLDLSDPNVLINRRIMNGTDANRPAETDVARIAALLTMTELNTVDDSLYFSTAEPVAMDAVDYRGQNVGAYIDDCRQASGKNAYIWYREATGEYSLWYDFDTSASYDSGCSLSNTLSEIDHSTVFAYSQERTYINFDPSRVASGIYLDFDNATDSPVYVQDATTLATFAAIDWAAPSVNVKTLAKATARANRYLADASTEDPVIHTVMTKVPRAKVNAVKKGQIVNFKAEWGPGYESYVRCRVLYRTVTEISEDPQASFEIEMDLTPVPLCIVQFGTECDTSGGCQPFEWDLVPAETNLLIGALAQRAISTHDATIVPMGTTDPPPICNPVHDIAGTDWTFIAGIDTRSSSGGEYPITMAWRQAEASEPQDIRWGGTGGGLNGGSGPRSHQVEVSCDMSGVPDVVASSQFQSTAGSAFTTASIVTTGAGYIFWFLSYSAPGPGDGFSAEFEMVPRAPAVGLTSGYCGGGAVNDRAPYSIFGYLKVAAAGTYSVTCDRSAVPRDPTNQYGSILAFWAT